MKGGKNFQQRGDIMHPCNDHMANKIHKRRDRKKRAKAEKKRNRK